jgi:tetratricopeptide (TPR) repeat protein
LKIRTAKKTLLFFTLMSLSLSVFCAAPEAYFIKGKELFKKGMFSQAMKYYKAAAKLDKTNPEYYLGIGECYRQMGQSDKAMLYYDYVDRLGGNQTVDEKYEKQVTLIAEKSNFMGSNALILFSGIVDLYYERRILQSLSLGVDAGYIYLAALAGFTGSNGKKGSGYGYMLGARLNWFIEKEALAGMFVGPEFYYYYVYYNTGSYENKAGIITPGLHAGYRWLDSGGFFADIILGVCLISGRDIYIDRKTTQLAIVLPTLGLYLGGAF